MISNSLSKCRFWAVSAAIILLAAGDGFTQDNNEAPVLLRARRCFAVGDTFSAVTEYKRFLFFCGDRRVQARICREVSDSFRLHDFLEPAGRWLVQAAEKADDSAKNGLYCAAVAQFIRCGNYREAAYNFQFVDTAVMEAVTKRDYLLYRGLLMLYNSQWNDAFGCLREYLAPCPCVRGSFEEWVVKNPPPGGKSRTAARLLSLLLPGAGQAYAGDPGGALNGLFLNGITGYPAVRAVLSQEWIDASLYLWLFSRFYLGGLEVAAEKADNATDRKRLGFARQVVDNLLSDISPCYREAKGIKKKERR
jgi:hypothetical protein